jgi:hypothetical protein
MPAAAAAAGPVSGTCVQGGGGDSSGSVVGYAEKNQNMVENMQQYPEKYAEKYRNMVEKMQQYPEYAEIISCHIQYIVHIVMCTICIIYTVKFYFAYYFAYLAYSTA